MAKKTGRPKGDRDDITVKVDREVIERLRVVAAAKRLTLAEFLSEVLGPIADKEEQKLGAKFAKKATKDHGDEV